MNAVIVYGFHSFIHEQMITECDGHCLLLKTSDKTDEDKSQAGVKISSETLSVHIAAEQMIQTAENCNEYITTETDNLFTIHLSKPTPPPKV